MARLKKSLALLLAVVMMFSSMSVAASAFDPMTDGGSSIDFVIKFFRKDAKTGEWIETERAKPGEAVKARVYITTDYAAFGGEMALLFDSDFFTPSSEYGTGEGTASVDPPKNKNYMNGTYNLWAAANWKHDESAWTYDMDFIGANMIGGADPGEFFATRDIISSSWGFGNGIKSTALTGDWVLEYDLVVTPVQEKDAPGDEIDRTKVIGQTGYAEVPPFHYSYEWDPAKRLFVDIYKDEEGGYQSGYGMEYWIPDFGTTSGSVTTTSKVIFDMGLAEAQVHAEKQGIIGTSVVDSSNRVADPAREGYTLYGWSNVRIPDDRLVTDEIIAELKELGVAEDALPAAGAKLTDEQVDLLCVNKEKVSEDSEVLEWETDDFVAYDYVDKTVYAVWEEAPTVFYTFKQFDMLPDGTYPAESDVIGEKVYSNAGAVINAPTVKRDGFTLDTTLSDSSITVSADNSSVFKAYYARNRYTVTYHFEDALGAQTDELSALYGAAVPAFKAGGTADYPVKKGYDFVGWSTDPDKYVAAPTTMPYNNIDLYPIYAIQTYTFVFDAVDGKFPTSGNRTYSKNYTFGQTTEEPEEPVLDGYTFVGWDQDIPKTASGNMTFEAMYNQNEYEVIFMDGDKVLDSYNAMYGAKILASDVPDGYRTENSWTLQDGTVVNFPYEVKDNVTLYATDSSNVYDALFYVYADETEKKDEVLYATVPTVYENNIVAPGAEGSQFKAPEKDGYNFIGWTPDPTDSVMDTDGFKAVAIFEPKTITVTFDANGGSAVNPIEKKYEDKIAELPETKLDGYEFAGWYTEKEGGDKVTAPYAVPTKDTTLYAHWNALEYSIDFVDEDGKTPVLTPIKANTGDNITPPSEPTKPGHRFLNWIDPVTKEEVQVPAKMPAGGKTLMAKWEKLSYDFILDANGGKFENESGELSGKIPFGEPLTYEEPENAGSEFLGWAYADDATNKIIAEEDLPATMPEGGLSLKAVWKTNTHRVVFDANQGYFTDDAGNKFSSIVEDVEYGKPIPVPAKEDEPKRDKYVFIGWSPALPEDGLMPDTDVTYVAQWEAEASGPVEYTVNAVIALPGTDDFITQQVKTGTALPGTKIEIVPQGTGTETDVVYIDYETLIDIESNEPDYENPANKTELTVSENTTNTLTVYFKLKEFTVTFDAGDQGGKWIDPVTEEETTKKEVKGSYGYPVTAPEAPKRTGYTFGGWSPEFVSTTFTQNTTYNAIWNIQKHKVTFTVNGQYYDEAEYEYGKTISAPSYDVPDGYVFSGWTITPSTMGESDLTFDATLTAKKYKIVYTYTANPAGAATPADVENVTVSETVILADAPEMTGYTFDGWYYNGELCGDKFVVPAIAGNVDVIELTGSYKAENVNIYFNTGSPIVITPNPMEAEYGESVVLPGEDKMDRGDDYKFLGWYDAKDQKVNSPYVVKTTDDVVLNAKWAYKVSYSYTSAPAGAPDAPADKFYEENADVTIDTATPSTITIDGATYTFSGWKIGNNDAADFKMGTSPVEITGSWTKNVEPQSYTISYAYTGTVPTGANDLLPEAHTALEGAENVALKAALTTITVDGVTYTFSGWYYNGALATEIAKMPAHDVTVVGYWNAEPVEVKKYTLTLDPNGGTLNGSEGKFVASYEADTAIPPVATPVRTGYRFICWKDADGNPVKIPATMPASDVSYKAEWSELYDVVYENEDGTEYDKIPDAGIVGEEIPETTKGDPSKDGYNFVGWVDAETGKAVSTIPEGGVTLKPVFEEIVPDTYAVSYEYTNTELPNGAPALPLTTYKAENDNVTVEAKPVLEGYTFDGWKKDDVITESFLMPAQAVTLKGTWTVNEHIITLDANSGVFKDDNGATMSQFVDVVEYGTLLSDVIPAQPTREGYTFDGWDVTLPTTMPDKDVKATAKWKINEYTITFDSNGGSNVPTATYEFGADVTEPAKPTREGFNFIGWSPALPATMPAKNITVVAQWEAKPETKTGTLTMDANGGEFSNGKEEATKDFAVGETIDVDSLEKPTRDGYDFKGWDGIPEDGKMPEGGVTITAKWEEKAAEEYTINYYLADGGNTYHSVTLPEGSAITHPDDPKQTGATFIGWFDKNGNKVPDVMGSENLDVYAKFELNKYKATFMANGEVYDSFELLYGAKLEAPADPVSADPNKVFAGWEPSVPGTMPAEDMVFEAQWTTKPDTTDKYSAHFISDGKTVSHKFYAEGATIEVPEAPEKFGFIFVGWEPAVPATMPAKDMVFEAQWEVDKDFVTVIVGGTVVAGGVIATIAGINAGIITGVSIVGGIITIIGISHLVKHTHTVTYIVDGEVYKTYKVVEGTKIPVPADPVKDGFKFEGWNPEVPDKMGETDLVFEATWSEKSDDADVDVDIPDTGSVAGGLTAFAIISGAAAAAYVITRRKKED